MTSDLFELCRRRGLQGFYLMLAVLIGTNWAGMLERLHPGFEPRWLWLFDFLPALREPALVYGLHLLALPVLLATALRTEWRALRLLSAALVWFCLLHRNSVGAVTHAQAVWPVVALLFALPRLSFATALECGRVYVFSIYLCSGLFKLYRLAEQLILRAPDRALSRTLGEHLGRAYAEGSLTVRAPLEALNALGGWATLLWCLAIAFELSFLWPILDRRREKTFAVLAIGFHLGTLCLMGVWFGAQALLVAWLFFAMHADYDRALTPPRPAGG